MSRLLNPLSVVCDCVVFVQAIASDESPAARILTEVDSGNVRLYVSDEILREVKDVVNRPELRNRLPGLTDVRIEAFFGRLDKKAFKVRDVPRAFEYSRDPDDEPYINLAIAAGADYIVTRDSDLLDLMTGHTGECKEFRQRFRPLKVITPRKLLDEIEQARKRDRDL